MTGRPFVLFGTGHLVSLALSFALPLLAARITRGQRSRRVARRICTYLGVVLVLNWALWLTYLARIGGLTIGNELPLNLCDWATIATVACLLKPNQKSYELAYFWALGGTLQGMLTPDLAYDFPDIQFVLFFVYHGGIVAGVIYLTFALGFRPYPSSLPRVIAWSLFYACVAGLADWLLKTNYGLLRAKPIYPSVLDLMPAWPWYIPILILLGFVSALVYYAPWFVADQFKRLAKPAE
jgi:hypothetical integral membrane protein (TIGR02206 family)